MSDKTDHLLIRTLRGEPVERPPVWAMRQAGRWDPEFNKLRGNLSFYEFSENAELAAQASLLPRRFGVDAIILFYDITTLAVAMGLEFELQPDKGPVPVRPIRSEADVERLANSFDPEDCTHLFRMLELVKKELAGSLPIIVFAGAPFTLASYCIGTGKDITATRRFAEEQSDAWYRLLPRITIATHDVVHALEAAGADAFQLFDSWAGKLSHEEYEHWCQRWHQLIFGTTPPSLLFVKECPHLDLMVQCGANAVSLGSQHDLAATKRQHAGMVFQGNVDATLLRTGTPEQVYAATHRCVEAGGGQRHVVNLNHGVDRNTPVENFEAFVQAVKSWTPSS